VLAVGACHYSAVFMRFPTNVLFLLPCQIRYLELKAQERDVGSHPTKLKASVCADLLLKLCTATGRYAKVGCLLRALHFVC
jgi:hypothetical protein